MRPGDLTRALEASWCRLCATSTRTWRVDSESIFGVDAGGNIDGDTLLEVLNQPVQGDAEAILGKQAVGALLNASSTGARS